MEFYYMKHRKILKCDIVSVWRHKIHFGTENRLYFLRFHVIPWEMTYIINSTYDTSKGRERHSVQFNYILVKMLAPLKMSNGQYFCNKFLAVIMMVEVLKYNQFVKSIYLSTNMATTILSYSKSWESGSKYRLINCQDLNTNILLNRCFISLPCNLCIYTHENTAIMLQVK